MSVLLTYGVCAIATGSVDTELTEVAVILEHEDERGPAKHSPGETQTLKQPRGKGQPGPHTQPTTTAA